MTQALAIFDLDDTLTLQDTESLWQQYLVHKGLLSSQIVFDKISLFKQHYNEGCLDIQSVVDFSLSALRDLSYQEQKEYQEDFATTVVRAHIPKASYDLISRHREQGHSILIISAGHEFIVRPATASFDVDGVLCTKLKRRPCGAFTPEIDGRPLFQEGKIWALKDWLAQHNKIFDTMYFYSDSINDLPLLEYVDIPIAINPCDRLRPIALLRNWPIIDIKKVHFPSEEPISPANSSA